VSGIKIECGVNDCTHNNMCYCSLGKIKVKGLKAKVSDQTCCDSFKRASILEDLVGKTEITNADSIPVSSFIKCEAIVCNNNAKGRCSLDAVQVDNIYGCTSCDKCEDTCCTSFIAR